MSDNDKREAIRHAVAESLGYGFSESVFQAADSIADAILVDELTEDHEIADGMVSVYTRDLVTQWLELGAHNAAGETGTSEPTTDAEQLMRADVFTVLFDAASAGLAAAEEWDNEH